MDPLRSKLSSRRRLTARMTRKSRPANATRAKKPKITMTAMAQCGNEEEDPEPWRPDWDWTVVSVGTTSVDVNEEPLGSVPVVVMVVRKDDVESEKDWEDSDAAAADEALAREALAAETLERDAATLDAEATLEAEDKDAAIESANVVSVRKERKKGRHR